MKPHPGGSSSLDAPRLVSSVGAFIYFCSSRLSVLSGLKDEILQSQKSQHVTNILPINVSIYCYFLPLCSKKNTNMYIYIIFYIVIMLFKTISL